MLPGETVLSGAPKACERCGKKLKPVVNFKNGRVYIGTECCRIPITRESEYYKTPLEAEADLPAFQAAFEGTGPIPKMARSAGFNPNGLRVEAYDESKGDFLDWLRGD